MAEELTEVTLLSNLRNLSAATSPSVRVDFRAGKDLFGAIYDYQQSSYTFTHVTNKFTAAATVQKANQMATSQYYHNYLSQKFINKSWIKFLGFNAGTPSDIK